MGFGGCRVPHHSPVPMMKKSSRAFTTDCVLANVWTGEGCGEAEGLGLGFGLGLGLGSGLGLGLHH